ncbi:hypothetical protein KBY97_11580 [Synechococcus sp. ATX 2A4]|uniref:ribbon-helix-helix domain-containing protein n=1 Tax=Synechococcus sp. ATX 2A4 TaxID=2823727 RepID=UPI0020CD5F4C|nr:hypothetical protein [Synechococcus sp. ATX 2A4]MCP9885756.1 hypothetical protein [Synechococcus sp. ATX 2A4]
MATRQTSASGRPKSPRIQVVLPEELCERLAAVAEAESRTVSNMAKVLIQQGLDRLDRELPPELTRDLPREGDSRSQRQLRTDQFRQALERQQRNGPGRLRGAPRRLRFYRPAG